MAQQSPNYDALINQIQTLSDLQNNGSIHSADPAKQAAYIRKLQQQAESIRRMLKLLNVSDQPPRASNGHTQNISGDFSETGDLNGDRTGNGDPGDLLGYEQLWELSTTVCEDEVPELPEDEDILEDHGGRPSAHRRLSGDTSNMVGRLVLDDQRDLYENTAVCATNLTLSVEVPPPLPPRLPNRLSQSDLLPRSANQSDLLSRSANQSEITSRSGNQSERSEKLSQSERSADLYSQSKRSNSSKNSELQSSSKKLNESNFDVFSLGGLNCSTPHPATNSSSTRSCITSTPKEVTEVDARQKIQALKTKRSELIGELQADDQEKQWYYTQLQLISQEIRNIPLTQQHSYSVENESARQELEERAARVQASMQNAVGDPGQAIKLRRHKVHQIREIDSELSEMESVRGRVELRNDQAGSDDVARARAPGHPQSCNLEQLYHEAIPMDRALSHSGPAAFGNSGEDAGSVISFTSSVHSVGAGARSGESADANSIMAMFGCTDVEKMSRTLLAMSSSPANCDMMRGSRCIQLLVQLLHLDPLNPNLPRPPRPVRARAARCLHNIVHAHPTDKHCKREAKVLKLLEVLRQYCDLLRDILGGGEGRGGGNSRATAQAAGCRRVTIQVVEGGEKYQDQDLMVADFGNIGEGYPTPCKQVYACHHFIDFAGEARQTGQVINIEESMAVLTRCSFDESHRQPIFLLGGIPALAELIQVEHGLHGATASVCREVRRYAVVALTNLTFGNTTIKSYLCQFPGLVEILVGQLESQWENLRKATAHLFRNLAWKADKTSKSVLSESRVVYVLMSCAMVVADRCKVETADGLAVEPGREEPTLKVILSALWNLSAHCRKNKSEVCSYPGALKLLVQFLRSRSTAVVENGGGILRNISSYIATAQQGDEYRKLLRDEDCLSLLLSQLRSSSLTIVSNSCGTLWNFSARSKEDQELLWELGAVPMLQSLTNSKHKTISTCSLAALKNLYTARPAGLFMMVSGAGTGQLTARKVKNLVADLDEKLSDCGGRDVEDGRDSPATDDSASEGEERPRSLPVQRSDSRTSMSSMPSVTSHYSDSRDTRSSASPDRINRFQAPAPSAPYIPLTRSGYTTDSSTRQSESPPALPKRGEGAGFKGSLAEPSSFKGSLSAEGRFDGNYKNFIKQYSSTSGVQHQYALSKERLGSPHRGEEVMYRGEEVDRVMSPTSLNHQSAVLSPGSIPLDLSKKKPEVLADEGEMSEEKPTDYSLRFMESEEPEMVGASKPDDKDDQLFDDSVKTYYTEGTPLDTPYAFSTATSMSDLREPAIQEEDEEAEKQGDSTTQYAVEGTPVTFSRAESLSSLESGEVEGAGEGNKLSAIPETGEEKGMAETEGSEKKKDGGHTPPPPKDHKTVTFRGGANNPAHETPMMFSRASSIGSLDSFDQQSIPDGYSSCDFSRATSGRVSPSDLPDSPSQTMPASPTRRHAAPPRPSKDMKPPLAGKTEKPMFGDGFKTFDEEGTPAVFSTRTSLSGLDFDDEPCSQSLKPAVKEAWPEPAAENADESQDLSEEEDIYADSESLLDQIINSGMPKEAKKDVTAKTKSSKLPLPNPRINESTASGGGGSDDSVCSVESTDILEACIASAMPSKSRVLSPVARLIESGISKQGLGPRQAGEGAPSVAPAARKQIPLPRKKMTPERRGAPMPPERRGSHLSHPCARAAAALDADLSHELLREEQAHEKIRYDASFRSESDRCYLPDDSRSTYPRSIDPLRVEPAPPASDQLRSYRVEDTPINFSAATSLSDLTADDALVSGRVSVDSHDGLLEHKRNRRSVLPRSRLTSGGESSNLGGTETPSDAPLKFSTEDTPAVFSRNDSLSSLEYEDSDANQQKGPAATEDVSGSSSAWGGAQGVSNLPRPLTAEGVSLLPRPLTVGRSASSGSSTGAPDTKPSQDTTPAKPNKSFNSSLSSLSIDSLNNTNDDEENLLADCISSAMPKSKSEHFNLSGKVGKKSRKSPRREKSGSNERELRRGSSKSPRNSRIIPGVVIPELKLKPKSRPVSGEVDTVDAPVLPQTSQTIPLEKLVESSPSTWSRREHKSESKDDAPSQPRVQPNTSEPLRHERMENNISMEDEPEVLQQKQLQSDKQTSDVKVKPKETAKELKDMEEMIETLTQSRISDFELTSSSRTSDFELTGSQIAREAGAVAARFDLSQDLSLTDSQYSQGDGGLSLVQPPSLMMESLPSLTSLPYPPNLPTGRRPSDGVRLECRHTLSAKMGSSVPLAVRRALGGSSGYIGSSASQEDLSSLSSCLSNLDNIRPPTIMDDLDMENSMVSVASISSEVAAAALAGSGGSDDTSAMSLTSEAILDIVRPAGVAVEAFNCDRSISKRDRTISLGYSQVSEALESVEEVTLINSSTLVPPVQAGATFVVEDGGDTIADVTDIVDDESVVEPTLTAGGSDAIDGEVPELPRDSRNTTPAQSCGESSVETTPLPARRLSPRDRRQTDPDRFKTFTKSNNSSPRDESGYKSQENSSRQLQENSSRQLLQQLSSQQQPQPLSSQQQQLSSRQQRLVDEDRFKTQTISKEDLNASLQSHQETNGTSSSPKSLKQRRLEEADRFKTQVIIPADLAMSPDILESEARLVVETIAERRAAARSRSTSVDFLQDDRSRSASVEILGDDEMLSFDVGSVSSRENLLDIKDETASRVPRPRIVKPWESRVVEEETPGKSIGGRRRMLYSPPMKRATIPPAVPPKPQQAKVPRATSSPVTSPKLVRGTRAMALRQANSAAKKESKTSPKLSPRSFSNTSGSSIGSPRSVSSGGSPKSRVSAGSRTQSPQQQSSTEKPVLVRQGTFTKDDSPKKVTTTSISGIPRSSPASANIRQASSVSLRGSTSRTPPKIAPKPATFRRDTIQPCPAPKPLVATTKTQQLREKSLTRGGLRGSNSSTSSVASKASTVSRTSIRTSSSSHSLRNAAETPPKRTPSSSEIERRGTIRPLSPLNRQYLGGRALSPSTRPLSPKTPVENFKAPAPKKDVTSKIASLWKKVEDSKKKKETGKDKRIWISKGKIQDAVPEPQGRLIRSGTYEKLSGPSSTSNKPSTDLKETKVRSRSRLSMKLSKFGLKRKGAAEDQVNGNTPVSPDELGNSLGSDQDGLVSPSLDDVDDISSPVESSESMSTGPDGPDVRPQGRSPASAIVAPFNYKPNGQSSVEQLKNAQLKRNSSYVSSMGRKQASKEEIDASERKVFVNTSSSVVTLV